MPTQTAVSFNALGLIKAAFLDIGAISAQGQLTAYMGQDGLRRLNNMVSSWATMPLTFPFVSREVFPIVANQNTYTIGPGGDFDTVRPQSLTGAGLLLNASPQIYTITSVSKANSTFTVAGNQTSAFPVGMVFTVTGSTGNDNSYTVRSSAFGSATVITVLEAVLDATIDGTIHVSTATNPVEIPRSLITDDAYQALRLKQLSSLLWTDVYYNATYGHGLGTIFIWPTPTTTINDFVLYRADQIAGFSDLTTNYDFPPGYQDALEYNLAVRLAIPYGRMVTPELRQMASDSLALIKRQNYKLTDLAIDPALTHSHAGWYNIDTGSGGGT